jgi:hypothetical protein
MTLTGRLGGFFSIDAVGSVPPVLSRRDRRRDQVGEHDAGIAGIIPNLTVRGVRISVM